jgi:hypothetical protein
MWGPARGGGRGEMRVSATGFGRGWGTPFLYITFCLSAVCHFAARYSVARISTEPGAGSPGIISGRCLTMTVCYVPKGNLSVACYRNSFAFVDNSAVVKALLSGDSEPRTST